MKEVRRKEWWLKPNQLSILSKQRHTFCYWRNLLCEFSHFLLTATGRPGKILLISMGGGCVIHLNPHWHQWEFKAVWGNSWRNKGESASRWAWQILGLALLGLRNKILSPVGIDSKKQCLQDQPSKMKKGNWEMNKRESWGGSEWSNVLSVWWICLLGGGLEKSLWVAGWRVALALWSGVE